MTTFEIISAIVLAAIGSIFIIGSKKDMDENMRHLEESRKKRLTKQQEEVKVIFKRESITLHREHA